MILLWSIILLVAIFFNLFYCTFSIFFYTDFYGWFAILLELISFLIYLTDALFVSRLSSYNQKNENFNQDRESILFQYVNKELIFDIFSTFPFSSIYDYLSNNEETHDSKSIVRILRLLRLIKFQRFYSYINKLKVEYNREYKYFTFLQLFFGYFFLNHIAAGIMYMICKYEYERSITYD